MKNLILILLLAVTANAQCGAPMPRPPVYFPNGGRDNRPIPPGMVERVFMVDDTVSQKRARIWAHPGYFFVGTKNYRVLMTPEESARIAVECKQGCKVAKQ